MSESATTLCLFPNDMFSGYRRACSIHLQLVILLKSHNIDQFTKYQLTILAIFPSKIILQKFYKKINTVGS